MCVRQNFNFARIRAANCAKWNRIHAIGTNENIRIMARLNREISNIVFEMNQRIKKIVFLKILIEKFPNAASTGVSFFENSEVAQPHYRENYRYSFYYCVEPVAYAGLCQGSYSSPQNPKKISNKRVSPYFFVKAGKIF